MKTTSTLFIILFSFAISSVQGQHKYSCSADAIAFGGNDLVSYFDGNPAPGIAKYSVEHDGIKVQFKNYDNLLKFKKDPEKYLPKYGGWCATAVASNHYIKPDYNMYKIQDGELFFFEVKAFYNGKTHWERNPEINAIVADKKYTSKFNQ